MKPLFIALAVALALSTAPAGGVRAAEPDQGPGMMGSGEMGQGMMGRGEMGPGTMLYQQECSRCHGTNGKGDGPDAAKFTPPPADLTSPSFWQGMTAAKIAEAIRRGYGKMPAFPDLSPGQVDALVAYLHSAFQPR